MQLKKEIVSNKPKVLNWLALAFLIYFFLGGISKETVEELPHATNLVFVGILVLSFFLRLTLEKYLPKHEVIIAKVENGRILLTPNGRKYLKISLPISEIKNIHIGKSRFYYNLYIFLEDYRVEIISDTLSEIERLNIYINNAVAKS